MFPGGRRERIPLTPPRSRESSRAPSCATRSQLATPLSLPNLHDPPPAASSPGFAEKLAKVKKAKQVDPALHLKISPMQQGAAPMNTTTYSFYSNRPVQMANNSKWSTDLKVLDRHMKQMRLYEVRLTAATPGGISPEPKGFRPPSQAAPTFYG
eukprot:TRINITY_DN92739_c0_g1_i1.p2 TRINITY_DN92739_c0_g1~~TRINITY_DN92739_c0_g1_i1.p2  ORF type:complete len:154 (+),score=29.99 TRINITY_DN92739_c0_g1_i1:25-486(+)